MDDLDEILETLTDAGKALAAQFTTVWVPIQLTLIALAAVVGWGITTLLRRRIDMVSLTMGWPLHLRRAARVLIDNLGIVLCILLLVIFRGAMQATMSPSRFYLIGVAAKLATAWIVIAVLASLIRNQFVNGVVSAIAWSIAALSILNLLEPVRDALDSTGMVIGGLRITALLAIKTTALLLLALWAASVASNFLDARVRSFKDLTPSIQVLLGKLIRIGLITFAVLVVLSSSASTSRRSRCSPARSASASASACRRSSPTWSAASSCWPTSRSNRATSFRWARPMAGSSPWARATSPWCRATAANI